VPRQLELHPEAEKVKEATENQAALRFCAGLPFCKMLFLCFSLPGKIQNYIIIIDIYILFRL
jgi:hypothetical protein